MDEEQKRAKAVEMADSGPCVVDDRASLDIQKMHKVAETAGYYTRIDSQRSRRKPGIMA